MSHTGKSPAEQEPERGLARIAFKLQTQGPKWIWRRLHSEWILPTTRLGRVMHAGLRSVLGVGLGPIRSVRRVLAGTDPGALDTLYAFYDLKVQPVTFDVLWFLAGAELERQRRRLREIHVLIVPGSDGGVRQEDVSYETVIDRESRKWRIHNIIIASLSLLSSCTGFTLANSRTHAKYLHSILGQEVYPSTYEPSLPVAHHPNECLNWVRNGGGPVGVLRATRDALRSIDRWMIPRARGRHALTITLRDYAYMSARNSNLLAWAQFARRLDLKKYFPIFVLDTERTLDLFPAEIRGFEVFKEASWNMGLRMALYERSWLNLGVNTGPMCLCWLNGKTRYLTFKFLVPSVPQTTVAFHRSLGFEPNQSLPFATALQKWVWEEDSLPVIECEFQSMVSRIESIES